MANIKSQIKRIKQNQRRHDRNQGVRTRLKSEAKQVRAAVQAGDAEAAAAALRDAARRMDQAASKGVLSKRAAARKKSRLAKRVARGKTG